MAGRKRYSVMRDPVHGDVYLTHDEMRVLDTPEMQRLRGVKQLGPAYLVYPGAVHTRFDHSIGTVHVAGRMIQAINLSFELDPARNIGISEEEARVIRIAALVHNVEDQDQLFRRHDSAYRYERVLDPGTVLGRTLADLGVRDDVFSILTKPGVAGAREIPPYWRQVISGTIAADILDYLARDAYFTGLRLQVDERVTSYFKVDRATGNVYIDLAKQGLLREDILSEVVRMLEARYYFSERVYYHHAKVSAGALIARAIDLLVRGDALHEEDLYDQDDASILGVLETAARRLPQQERSRVEDCVRRFRDRRLYKRVCVIPRYGNEAAQEALVKRFFAPGATGGGTVRADVEARIEDLVRFATGREVHVILYCPAHTMQLKEARIHVRWPGEPRVRPLSDFADKVPRLGDLETSYRNLWKFYVLADSKDRDVLRKVQEIALAELPGVTNVYRVPYAG
jgi:HD superfamily phosphohydrolase